VGIITSFVILSSGWNFSLWISSFKSVISIAVCTEQGHSDLVIQFWSSQQREKKKRNTHPPTLPSKKTLNKQANKIKKKNPQISVSIQIFCFYSRKLLSNATSEFSWQNSHHWIYTVEKAQPDCKNYCQIQVKVWYVEV